MMLDVVLCGFADVSGLPKSERCHVAALGGSDQGNLKVILLAILPQTAFFYEIDLKRASYVFLMGLELMCLSVPGQRVCKRQGTAPAQPRRNSSHGRPHNINHNVTWGRI